MTEQNGKKDTRVRVVGFPRAIPCMGPGRVMKQLRKEAAKYSEKSKPEGVAYDE